MSECQPALVADLVHVGPGHVHSHEVPHVNQDTVQLKIIKCEDTGQLKIIRNLDTVQLKIIKCENTGQLKIIRNQDTADKGIQCS